MDDLIAFVTARLDEDETEAKAAAAVAGPDWHHKLFLDLDGAATTMIVSAAGSPLADTLHRDDEEMAPFIARHDPGRVLREVGAKRAVIAIHDPSRHPDDPSSVRWCPVCITGRHGYPEEWGDDPYPCLTLRQLAAVWSDHPDYRQEWAAA